MKQFFLQTILFFCFFSIIVIGSEQAQKEKLNQDLITAANYPNNVRVQKLLQLGADINAQNKDGWTALHYAAFRNSITVANILLAAKARTDMQTKSGITALHFASHCDYVAIMNAILTAGADINIKTSDGYTALSVAVENNHLGAVRILLAYDATIDKEKVSKNITNEIKQELHFYETFQTNPTLKNQLRKKAYQEYRKGKPGWLHLLLGLDFRMQDKMAENWFLKIPINANKDFFRQYLGDHFFDQIVLEPIEKSDRDSIETLAYCEFEQLRREERLLHIPSKPKAKPSSYKRIE